MDKNTVLNELIEEGLRISQNTAYKQKTVYYDPLNHYTHTKNITVLADPASYKTWITKVILFLQKMDPGVQIYTNYPFECKIAELTDNIAILRGMVEFLETQQGITKNLNDPVNILHVKIVPDIYEHIERYLENGDYFHAVEEAYKIVRQKLHSLTGCERAIDVFNPNSENRRYYACLFGAEPTNAPEIDFYRGVGYLHLGIQFLRNEKVHKPADELDENLAFHYLILASLAYQLISRNCTK